MVFSLWVDLKREKIILYMYLLTRNETIWFGLSWITALGHHKTKCFLCVAWFDPNVLTQPYRGSPSVKHWWDQGFHLYCLGCSWPSGARWGHAHSPDWCPRQWVSGASSVLCQAPNIANMLRKVSELKIALWGWSTCREVTAQAQLVLCNLGPCCGPTSAFWGRFEGFLVLLVPTLPGFPAHADQPRRVVPVPTVWMQIIRVTYPSSKKMGKNSPLGSLAALSSVMVIAFLFLSQVSLFLFSLCRVSVKCPWTGKWAELPVCLPSCLGGGMCAHLSPSGWASVCRCWDLYRQTWQHIPIYSGRELWAEMATFFLCREEQVILRVDEDVAVRFALGSMIYTAWPGSLLLIFLELICPFLCSLSVGCFFFPQQAPL